MTGELSWRRLGVLIGGLPSTSLTLVAVNGPELEWDAAEYLLAMVVDLLAGGNWQRGGGKGPRPRPVFRPGRSQRNTERMGAGRGLPLDQLKEALDNWSKPEGGEQPSPSNSESDTSA